MNPCVYILVLANTQYYVGSTNDIKRRFIEHTSGHCVSTKGKLPCKLVFTQEFETLKEARQIEYKIKKQKSHEIIGKIIKREIIF